MFWCRRWSVRAGLILVAVCSTSCASRSGSTSAERFHPLIAPVSYEGVSDTVPEDPNVAAIIVPYRDRLAGETARVIGVAVSQFDKARPEGALGNLAADAMLTVVQMFVGDSVHIAVTNNGGLRVPIREGQITVGEIFEVSPFENYLTVVELSGAEVQELANDIARVGGEPIAGFSFHIDDATGTAQDIRVGGEPLQVDRTYRAVTLDYLLDGGDAMRTLWQPRPRTTTNVLLRDAIIQFIEERGEIRPVLQDRVIHVAR